jgi:hypothetical protein
MNERSAIEAELQALKARRADEQRQRDALLARAVELAEQIREARASRSQRLPRLLTEPDEPNYEPFKRHQAGWWAYEQQRDADGPYNPFRQFWKAVGL